MLRRLVLSRRGALSVQVLGEYYSRTTRDRDRILPDDEAESQVHIMLNTWHILELSSQFVPVAMRISQRFQTSYYDALLVATASANGVRTFLTEDLQHGQLIEGVRILNPLHPGFDLALLD